jgi:hypothetical protein
MSCFFILIFQKVIWWDRYTKKVFFSRFQRRLKDTINNYETIKVLFWFLSLVSFFIIIYSALFLNKYNFEKFEVIHIFIFNSIKQNKKKCLCKTFYINKKYYQTVYLKKKVRRKNKKFQICFTFTQNDMLTKKYLPYCPNEIICNVLE